MMMMNGGFPHHVSLLLRPLLPKADQQQQCPNFTLTWFPSNVSLTNTHPCLIHYILYSSIAPTLLWHLDINCLLWQTHIFVWRTILYSSIVLIALAVLCALVDQVKYFGVFAPSGRSPVGPAVSIINIYSHPSNLVFPLKHIECGDENFVPRYIFWIHPIW